MFTCAMICLCVEQMRLLYGGYVLLQYKYVVYARDDKLRTFPVENSVFLTDTLYGREINIAVLSLTMQKHYHKTAPLRASTFISFSRAR